MMEKQGNGIGIGMASVLVIVVTLAFTTFGILSLATARADLEMSRKAASLVEDWYAAEGRMQERFAEIDGRLAAGNAVFTDGMLELKETVRGGQELQAVLRPAAGGYEVVSYELVNTGEWSPDSGMNIWGG